MYNIRTLVRDKKIKIDVLEYGVSDLGRTGLKNDFAKEMSVT